MAHPEILDDTDYFPSPTSYQKMQPSLLMMFIAKDESNLLNNFWHGMVERALSIPRFMKVEKKESGPSFNHEKRRLNHDIVWRPIASWYGASSH